MITNKKPLIICIVIAAFASVAALFTIRPDASSVFNRYVTNRPLGSLRILEYEHHRTSLNQWTAFFHFKIGSEDFSKLLQDANSTLLDTNQAQIAGFASLAVQVVQAHSSNSNVLTTYKLYAFDATNAFADDYLFINNYHSEGYIVIVRW
jgi:hypothetical protein